MSSGTAGGPHAGRTATWIVGLNDTQQAEIVTLFGPTVRRGKYFALPVLLPRKGMNVYLFLQLHKVPTVPVTKNEQSFSLSMK